MPSLARKTKAELLAIIEEQERQIADLKQDLEMAQKDVELNEHLQQTANLRADILQDKLDEIKAVRHRAGRKKKYLPEYEGKDAFEAYQERKAWRKVGEKLGIPFGKARMIAKAYEEWMKGPNLFEDGEK